MGSMLKILKFMFYLVSILLVGGGLLGLIGYVLYTANLIVGLSFMIVLGVLIGYFGYKIKIKLEKKQRESNIDEKIENQDYEVMKVLKGK